MSKLLLATAALTALLSPAAAQNYLPGPPIIVHPLVAAPLPPVVNAAPGFCFVNAPFTVADQYYGYQAAVLNIRAWSNGPILAALANGTPVQVLNVDTSNGSPWAYVVIPDGSAGWVFLQYLYCGR